MKNEEIERMRKLSEGGEKVGLNMKMKKEIKGGGKIWKMGELIRKLLGEKFMGEIKEYMVRKVDELVKKLGRMKDYYEGNKNCNCFKEIENIVERL